MKKTRNIFILTGNRELVSIVLEDLKFKGLKVLHKDNVTPKEIMKVFESNKSIACYGVSEEIMKSNAINIMVIDSFTGYPDLDDNAISIESGNYADQFNVIANNLNCDIGDHKSNSSGGLTEAPKRSDCPYCRYIDDGYDKDINLHRTLYKSENFFVMPTIGEFIKGYLLIIPFDHVMSNAELSSEVREEFLTVLEDVNYILRLTYPVSNTLVWENGSGNGGIGKAKTSIVHSHTHVAPSKLTADQIEKLAGFPLEKVAYKDLDKYGDNSYLLVRGENDDDWRINDNPNLYIPRQYVRQLLLFEDYNYFPDDVWDWRSYPYIDKIRETCADIKKALTAHWDELPERIKERTKDFL